MKIPSPRFSTAGTCQGRAARPSQCCQIASVPMVPPPPSGQIRVGRAAGLLAGTRTLSSTGLPRGWGRGFSGGVPSRNGSGEPLLEGVELLRRPLEHVRPAVAPGVASDACIGSETPPLPPS